MPRRRPACRPSPSPPAAWPRCRAWAGSSRPDGRTARAGRSRRGGTRAGPARPPSRRRPSGGRAPSSRDRAPGRPGPGRGPRSTTPTTVVTSLTQGGIEGGDQADDDGVVDLLRGRRQRARRLAGRDDRVVVADLRVVDDPTGEGQGAQVQRRDLVRLERPEVVQDARDLRLQVVAEVARVGPRVADELRLVERTGRP